MPQLGDVVSAYFPEDERPNNPGIKSRPCVILQVQRSDKPGVWYVRIAYGTTQKILPNELRVGDVPVTKPDNMRAAGLHKPTKFVLTRSKIIPYTHAYIRANTAGSSFLGELCAEDRRNAEIAIEKIKEQRAVQQASATRRPVQVQTR
jgi:hypothetical protein